MYLRLREPDKGGSSQLVGLKTGHRVHANTSWYGRLIFEASSVNPLERGGLSAQRAWQDAGKRGLVGLGQEEANQFGGAR